MSGGTSNSFESRTTSAMGRYSAHLDEVQLAVAAHHFFVRQVVVHVGGVHLHDLVAQERQRLQRIHRVQHQEAAKIGVILHRRLRHVERSERIIAQQHAQLRIIIGPALLIERAKLGEPHPAAHAGADADLEQINFRRKLILGFQIAQQGPEILPRCRRSLPDCGRRRRRPAAPAHNPCRWRFPSPSPGSSRAC